MCQVGNIYSEACENRYKRYIRCDRCHPRRPTQHRPSVSERNPVFPHNLDIFAAPPGALRAVPLSPYNVERLDRNARNYAQNLQKGTIQMRCRSQRSLATIILLCLSLLPLLPRPLSAAPAKTEPATASPIAIAAESVQALIDQNGSLVQPIHLVIQREGSPIDAKIRLGDAVRKELRLTTGKNELDVLVPAVKDAAEITVAVTTSDNQSASQPLVLKPVRPLTVYLLPHSHVDIGYTHVQTEVEAAQWRYLEMAIEAAKKSAGNPPGARFKWNTEVLWAVDSYLKQASPEKREAFFEDRKSVV